MIVQFKIGKIILIEKYTTPEIIRHGENDIVYAWKNKEGKMWRLNSLPALVQIRNKKLTQIWFSRPGVQKIILEENITKN